MPSSSSSLANGGNGAGTPVLTTRSPLLLLNNNFHYPAVPIADNGTNSQGFILHNCTIVLNTVSVLDSSCGGALCDQQTIVSGDTVAQRCACFQHSASRRGSIVFVLSVTVTFADGTQFETEFVSRYFMDKFVFNGQTPSSIRALHFTSDFMVQNQLYEATLSVLNYINQHGEFRVVGWVRRGEVADMGVDQPNNGLPYNAQRVMVEAGTLRYHITSLDPMTPEDIDLDVLHRLKFDVNGIRTN